MAANIAPEVPDQNKSQTESLRAQCITFRRLANYNACRTEQSNKAECVATDGRHHKSNANPMTNPMITGKY
eukprot:scaffold321034_cov36-Prasinocladus_malaysianus.AAC.1